MHGDPAFCVYREKPAEGRAVHDRQIRPVRNVVGKVIHIDGSCIQGVPQAASEVMASFRAGLQGAIFLGYGRLLELRDLRWQP